METQRALKTAYALLRGGETKAARALLRELAQQEPNNKHVWWLIAQAAHDPRHKRIALHRVLEIDPSHQQAEAALQQLNRPNKTGFSISLVWLVGALLGLGVGGAVLVLKEPNAVDVGTVVTASVQPSPTFMEAAHARNEPSPTATRTRTPLPPTWTPVPTNTPQRLPTFTPWFVETPLATADPVLFGDTYWEGTGDGFTLETYTRSGGRHLRFYDFPVRVHLEVKVDPPDPIWQQALDHAIEQVTPYVPMVQVQDPTRATLIVKVLSPTDYEAWTNCPALETAGCATLYDLGDFGGGDHYHRIVGEATISTKTRQPIGTMLHEILHALGVMVHSPDADDIMYVYETSRITLSQRDVNTLRRLYANPAYGSDSGG